MQQTWTQKWSLQCSEEQQNNSSNFQTTQLGPAWESGIFGWAILSLLSYLLEKLLEVLCTQSQDFYLEHSEVLCATKVLNQVSE